MKKAFLTLFLIILSKQISFSNYVPIPLKIDFSGVEIYEDRIYSYGNSNYVYFSLDSGNTWKHKKISTFGSIDNLIKVDESLYFLDSTGNIYQWDNNLNTNIRNFNISLDEEEFIKTIKVYNNNIYIRTLERVMKFNSNFELIKEIKNKITIEPNTDYFNNSLFTFFKDTLYLPFNDFEYEEGRMLLRYNENLELIDTIKTKNLGSKNKNFKSIYSDNNYIYYEFTDRYLMKTNDFINYDSIMVASSDIYIILKNQEIFNLSLTTNIVIDVLWKHENIEKKGYRYLTFSNLRDGKYRSKTFVNRFAITENYVILVGLNNSVFFAKLDESGNPYDLKVINEMGSVYFGDYSLPHQLSDGRIMALGGYDSFYQKELYYSNNNGETFHPLLDTSNQKFKNFTNRWSTAHLFYHDNIDNRYYFLHELVKIGTNLATLYSTNYDFNSTDAVDLKDNLSATHNPMEKLEVKKFNNTTYYKYNRSNQYGSGVTIYDLNLNRIINRKLGKLNSKLLFSSMLNENLDFIFFRDSYLEGKYELVFTDSSAINLKVIKTIDYEKYYNNNSITVNGMDYLGLCYFDSLKNKVIYEIMNCQTQEFITLKEADYNEEEIENYKKTALYYFEGKLYFAFLNSLFTIDFDKLNTNIWNELKFRDNGRIVKNMRMLNNTLFAYYSDDFNSEAIYKLENIDFTSSIETTEDFEIPTISILNLFPNPSENTVEISLNFDQRYDINNTEVTLFDINGIKSNNIEYNIIKLSVYNSKIIIDITNIVKGTYIINLNLGNQNITRKFVKN